MQILAITAVIAGFSLLFYKLDRLEKIVASQNDPLLAIEGAETDIETAVAAETATMTALIAELKQLSSQPTVDPAAVAALAAKFEASVANLNAANTAGQAALPPPPAPAA